MKRIDKFDIENMAPGLRGFITAAIVVLLVLMVVFGTIPD